jgi:hypothetical protein
MRYPNGQVREPDPVYVPEPRTSPANTNPKRRDTESEEGRGEGAAESEAGQEEGRVNGGRQIAVYRCPKCAWFRAKHDDAEWDTQKINHPVYGRISNLTLYNLDVDTHNCNVTATERVKYGINPKVTYKGRYEQRTEHAES